MKQIEDYVKDGWHLQLTVAPSRKGVSYHAWAYEHKEDKAAALVGEGETMESMLRDLQECEKELYPHLVNDGDHIQSNRTKKLPTVFRMRSRPEGMRTK